MFAAGMLLAQVEEPGKIMRPTDKSSHKGNTVDVVATAPGGKLTVDGKPLEVAQPFPDVFHTVLKIAPGRHTLALSWDGGRKEVRIFVGDSPPAGYEPFRQHPPLAGVECTQCHKLSARGRFQFKGGCFDCHKQESFAKVHTHPPSMLEQCGSCHNAHGSTSRAHLLYAKETACKLCHD